MKINCILCDQKTSKIQSYFSSFDSKEYSLMECKSCGTQFWHPLKQPEAAYYEDEIQDIYKEMHKGRKELDVRYKQFLHDFPALSEKTILDVGCSEGLFLETVQALGNRVYGIDIDSISVEKARQRGLEDIYNMDVDSFVDEAEKMGMKFDIITAFDVIEHLIDPVKVMKHLSRMLSPQGMLVGTVPNADRFLRDHIKTDYPPHHFFRFNKKSLSALLQASDYTVQTIAVIEYGYSGRMLLKSLLHREKPNKDTGINIQSSCAYSGAVSGKEAPQGLTASKKIKRLVSRTIRPFSVVVEKTFQKGFKLYFIARSNIITG